MSRLDERALRQSIQPNVASLLDGLEVLPEVDSTNSLLLRSAAPGAGRFKIAATDNQTAGRGRRDRRWESPPGSGLCISIAYTLDGRPKGLPALTLAVGMGVIEALSSLAIDGVMLKWPNDIVLTDAKLGGILTEVNHVSGSAPTVVTGIGINIDLPDGFSAGLDSEWAALPADLSSVTDTPPSASQLAAAIVNQLVGVIRVFDEKGFAAFENGWSPVDWLYGKHIVVDVDGEQIEGSAAGVDSEGALFVDTMSGTERVINGTIRVRQDVGQS